MINLPYNFKLADEIINWNSIKIMNDRASVQENINCKNTTPILCINQNFYWNDIVKIFKDFLKDFSNVYVLWINLIYSKCKPMKIKWL